LRLPGFSQLIIDLLRRNAYSRRGLLRAVHDDQLLTPQFIATAKAASRGFVAALKQIALTNAPALRTPTCPTLVVWGESDRLSVPLVGQRIAQEIPHAKFVSIKNAAHIPPIEQPDEFHAIVLPFLSGK
jgi:pimeloyl-ACP methyl ester carboxylesterase